MIRRRLPQVHRPYSQPICPDSVGFRAVTAPVTLATAHTPASEGANTMTVTLLLYLIATILLGLATAGVHLPRVHFGWAGLTLIAFTALVLPTV